MSNIEAQIAELTRGTDEVLRTARRWLADARPDGGGFLADLYCGVGLFGLSLADQVGRVTGIESEPSAAADFLHNANELEQIKLIEGEVQRGLDTWDDHADLVVLDPPRSGAGRRTMEEIARLAPRRVAYVSCDPATLARDARVLVDAGFDLDRVQPVDLFPQTYHVESLALFLRSSG